MIYLKAILVRAIVADLLAILWTVYEFIFSISRVEGETAGVLRIDPESLDQECLASRHRLAVREDIDVEHGNAHPVARAQLFPEHMGVLDSFESRLGFFLSLDFEQGILVVILEGRRRYGFLLDLSLVLLLWLLLVDCIGSVVVFV